MIGVERRKENLAAASLSNPLNKLAEIVIPERETPGMIAKACATPIIITSLKVICFISLFFLTFQLLTSVYQPKLM